MGSIYKAQKYLPGTTLSALHSFKAHDSPM